MFETATGLVAVPPFGSSEGCDGGARRFRWRVQLSPLVASVAEEESGALSPARCYCEALHHQLYRTRSVSSEGGPREVPSQLVAPVLEEGVGVLLPDLVSGKGLHRSTIKREGHNLVGRSREEGIGFPREDEFGVPHRKTPLVVPVLEEEGGVFLPDRVFDKGFHLLAISSEGLSLAGRSRSARSSEGHSLDGRS